jgi:hypothetical protein
MYAVVYPDAGSPKKMGPPEAAAPALGALTNAGVMGDGEGLRGVMDEPGKPVAGGRGRVSRDSVRRHEARTMVKEDGMTGSWVEV